MKNIFLIILLTGSFLNANAQYKSDSIAYQQQRKKINTMLTQRAAKFSQYDESLKMHSGIFGMQTKKDIRRSNAILMDIVNTDNDIYKEIKILLDFNAFHQNRVQSKSKEVEATTLGYMKTINKLRNQIDILKNDAIGQQKQMQKIWNIFIIVTVSLLAIILLLVVRRSNRRT
ncbi:MAG TPA: hypothetical protein VHA56_03615 [Mucilaginibacter sp.]|nr:hypothetical protein [Mucilaginibacter sp.]